MQDQLAQMIGSKVDIVCVGAAAVRGELTKVENGVAHLKDEHQVCYIAIDKIALVWEARDHDRSAGFVPGTTTAK